MPAEDHNGERSSQGVPRGVDHSLDSLARDLANGSVSRRKALRLLGGVLLGGALASIPGVAWAKPKPGKCNKDAQCPTGQVCVGGQCCAQVCGDQCCGADEYCTQPNEISLGGYCCPNDRYACGEVCCQSAEGCISGQCCPPELRCGGSGPFGEICCPSETYCAGADLCCQFDEVRCGNECVSTCPVGQVLDNSCQCVAEG
jgi:hypothetical protein